MEELELSESRERINSELGTLLVGRFKQAQAANQEYHDRCLRSLKLMNGEVDMLPSDPDNSDLDIAMNITRPIVRAVYAALLEILAPLQDKAFVLKAKPVAELPDRVREELSDLMEANVDRIVQMASERNGGIAPTDTEIRAILDNMTQTALQYHNEAAARAAENLTPIILTALEKGGFDEAIEEFIWHYCIYGTAFLKGPVVEYDWKKVWQGNYMDYEYSRILRVHAVTPFNIFPSAYAKDLNSCDYVFQRQRLSVTQLIDMRDTLGFDKESIDYVIQKMDKFILPYSITSGDKEPDANDSSQNSVDINNGIYDTVIYYGRLRGKDLIDLGVEVADENRYYESEVWIIDTIIIKAVIASDQHGGRGFFSASFYSNPGELWGTSIPEALEDVQIQCTTSARAMLKNMEFSSGPIGEVNTQYLVDDDNIDPSEVHPYMLVPTRAAPGNGPVYKFHQVPFIAGELWNIINSAYSAAFDLLGIPRLAFGDSTGQSTIGRTSGGVSMMLNQANKAIKLPLLNAEKRVFEPCIQAFVDYELKNNPDPSIKGDIYVEAKGARALQQREQQQDNLSWVLQSLAPFAQGFQVPPEYLQRILFKLLEGMGVPTKGLPNIALEDAVSEDIEGARATGMIPTNTNQDFTEALDGRSATAINAIEQANDPLGVGGGVPNA